MGVLGDHWDGGLQDSCALGCIDTPNCAVFLYCNSTVACTAAGGTPRHPFCSHGLLTAFLPLEKQ